MENSFNELYNLVTDDGMYIQIDYHSQTEIVCITIKEDIDSENILFRAHDTSLEECSKRILEVYKK